MARPRSDEARQAALAATLDVLAEAGVEGVTFDDVATRSGVAKSTLYRHFGSKQAMVVEAARSCLEEQPTPDTGDLAADLHFLFERYSEAEDRHRIPDLLPTLLDASARDAELREFVVALLDERRRPLRTVLQLAQLRGEIARDLDLDVGLALILGPLTQWRLVERREITPELTGAVLDLAVAALRSTVAAEV